jgi:hypothetical protein
MLQSVPTTYPADSGLSAESPVSAISWQAIFGGAVATIAIGFVLVLLGSGFGLTAISPWPNSGVSATTFTVAAGLWLIVVQWLASALGGFLTGRLRTKWVNLHTHEVFFRDTAHGLMTWGLATVIGAVIASLVLASAVGTATQASATVASRAAQGAGTLVQSRAYDIDSLFRGEKPELASSGWDARVEASHIFVSDLGNGDVPDADRAYLADQVAARTGLSRDDARKRVDGVIAQEKSAELKLRQAADTARKSASATAIFAALSMLIGAFIASVAAAYGGSLRDEHS